MVTTFTLLSVLITVAFCADPSITSIDDTVVVGADGKDVVLSTLEKIDSSCVFTKDKQMLRHIAYAESSDSAGNSLGGIWRVPLSIFQSTQGSNFRSYTAQFPTQFGVNWASVSYSDLAKPLYSALAARLALTVPEAGASATVDGPLPWNIQSQATIWKSAYVKGEAISALQARYNNAVQHIRQNICKGKAVDFAFVLDSSGSISPTHWTDMKNFVQDVIRSFPVGPKSAQFAVVTFSNGVYEQINLNQYSDQSQLVRAVGALRHAQGGTDTAAALERLRTTTFLESNGARRGSPKIAIVLTDGASNNPMDTASQATQLHKAVNVTVLTVGIGSYALAYAGELRAIATEPKCKNVYHLQQYQDLVEAFVLEIRQRICDEQGVIMLQPMIIDPVTGLTVKPPPITVTVPPGEYRGNCIHIPTDSDSTILMKVKVGTLRIYTSFSVRKPTATNRDIAFQLKPKARDFSMIITRSMIQQYAPSSNTPEVRFCLGFENEGSSIKKAGNEVEFDLNALKGSHPECGGNLKLQPNEVYDEGGPGYIGETAVGYPAKMECVWNLPEMAGYYYRIDFPYFNVIHHLVDILSKDSCGGADSVKIMSAGNAKKAGIYKEFCGKQTNSNKYSFEADGPVSVRFSSTAEAGVGYGFTIRITVLKD